jgi:hypothetical protein
MKDSVITAALVVSGFTLTLAFTSWRDGTSNFQREPAAAAAPSTPAFLARPETASQKPALSTDQPKVEVIGAPAEQTPAAAQSADGVDSVDSFEAPSYESQVDRDEEENHASRRK